MFCQVCGSRNPDDEELCVHCQSKLLVLSGVGVVEERGEIHEEIPFDEHLLERISTLEEIVKRTGDALKSLFESLGNLEKNLFVAHTGVLALQETLEKRAVIRPEEVRDLWETKLDERMQAVEKKDRFLERRDRIIGRFSGANRDLFTKRVREAEFALLALDADRDPLAEPAHLAHDPAGELLRRRCETAEQKRFRDRHPLEAVTHDPRRDGVDIDADVGQLGHRTVRPSRASAARVQPRSSSARPASLYRAPDTVSGAKVWSSRN